MTVRVIRGDCLEVMPTLDAESIDAIVCDPPYGLSFMGKAWDHGVPGVPFWIEANRVAKPGAYLLAFGGTRTFHRLTVAIEDAGWEIRDCLSWLYGSGFPKSLNIGEGRGTALKPAWEPIILARKPFKQTVAANVKEHETGALNIDACRIETNGEDMGDVGRFLASDASLNEGWQRPHKADTEKMAARAASRFERTATLGRWPANVCLDDEAAAMLDEQSGTLSTNPGTARSQHEAGIFGIETQVGRVLSAGDSGGASRFFYTAKAGRSEREEGLRGFAEQDSRKWSEREQGSGGTRDFYPDGRPRPVTTSRNHHPTVKPVDLMRWLVRLVAPPNGVVLDPFMGSGTTGIAAVLESKRFIGIEKEAEYCAIAEKRIAHWGAQGILNLDGVA